jgi:hypothetical protein
MGELEECHRDDSADGARERIVVGVDLLLMPTAARFWAKVERRGPDECWPFLGARSCSGYGSLNRRTWGEGIAHRLAWRLTNDRAIPENTLVCHRCDNPPCCNPAHLFLGTQGDNARDRNAKGRAASKVGRLNGRALLTEVDVREIREVYRRGHRSRAGDPQSCVGLARRFGVSEDAIRRIVKGRNWQHITTGRNG